MCSGRIALLLHNLPLVVGLKIHLLSSKVLFSSTAFFPTVLYWFLLSQSCRLSAPVLLTRLQHKMFLLEMDSLISRIFDLLLAALLSLCIKRAPQENPGGCRLPASQQQMHVFPPPTLPAHRWKRASALLLGEPCVEWETAGAKHHE